jgi:hypothetical protein
MGRISRWSEAALNSAVAMLATTNDQKFKANLIRTILDYDVRQRERAETDKAVRRKRAQNTELAELRSKVAELTAQVASVKNAWGEEISKLRACLEETDQIVGELRSDLVSVKGEADTARKDINRLQESLKLTNGIIEQLATTLPPEERNEFASELFQKFKSDEPELLAQLFKSMRLDLERWRAWDSKYGENTQSMVREFECPEKHGPEKLSLLRSKLLGLGIDVHAIDAVRDYRDLKIDFAELKERTQPHITFKRQITGLSIKSSIPSNLLPPLGGEALRIASKELKSKQQKLDWLQVAKELLQPDSETGVLLLKEIAATEHAAENSYS